MNFAVIPAAGRGSRLGRSKALLPFADSVVLDILAATLGRGGVDRVVVVGARGDDALFAHCRTRGYEGVVNDHPERGMLWSVQRGLQSLTGALDTGSELVICPVDFPGLLSATIESLLDAVARSPHGIAVPRFAGRRGHPLAISSRLAPAVHALDPTLGLRALLTSRPHEQIEVSDPGVHRDLDTWIDYLRLTTMVAKRHPVGRQLME